MQPKLGLIAGGGGLPFRLLAACRATGREVFVLALRGHAQPDLVDNVPHAWIRMGEAATGFDILRDAGVQEIVMAGPVLRPTLSDLRPSWRTARYLARVGLKGLGDDGLLKALIEELELEGFRVVGAHAILQGLLADEGAWGTVQPDQQALADIARGLEVAHALGGVDVGQSVVVQGGIVLGVEAAEGTDQLLNRCGGLHRDGPGGVLVKIAKPGQERRADLPTIGPETVRLCAATGLRGIAVEAQAAIVLERPIVIAEADKAGLFVCGVALRPPC
jgi:DUF1009 family protein